MTEVSRDTSRSGASTPKRIGRPPKGGYEAQEAALEKELRETITGFFDDPLGYVMFNWDWNGDRSIQQVKLPKRFHNYFDAIYGPDEWACDFLLELGEEIQRRDFNNVDPVPPIQFSTASGHGIGKTALSSWLGKFIFDTRPYSRGTITAMTDVQLRTKTWAELGKWHRRSLTAHWAKYTSSRGNMALRAVEAPEEWFCTAQTSREENSESFAGQHAPNSTSWYLFDEASGIADKIYEVRDGGLTDGEPMTFDFGNPTRNSGEFFENTVGKNRSQYIVRQIDSRKVSITNKPQLEKWRKTWGEDSDRFKVRVRGLFPNIGSQQFMPTDEVEAAMTRPTHESYMANGALVIGVDVARFGEDNSVIYPRIGYDARSFPYESYNGLNTTQLVGKVIKMVQRFRSIGKEVAAIFVDATGGSIGGGVADQLRALGYPAIDVGFGNKAVDSKKYRYRVDEMWGDLRDALPRLLLPEPDTDQGRTLHNQMTKREFDYITGEMVINLESKSDFKTRFPDIGSPDETDALALTFAQEVAPAVYWGSTGLSAAADSDYDPLEARD